MKAGGIFFLPFFRKNRRNCHVIAYAAGIEQIPKNKKCEGGLKDEKLVIGYFGGRGVVGGIVYAVYRPSFGGGRVMNRKEFLEDLFISLAVALLLMGYALVFFL